MPLGKTLNARIGCWDCAMEAHARVYSISASLKLPSWKYLKCAISFGQKDIAIQSNLFPSSLRRVALLAIALSTLVNYSCALSWEAEQAGF